MVLSSQSLGLFESNTVRHTVRLFVTASENDYRICLTKQYFTVFHCGWLGY